MLPHGTISLCRRPPTATITRPRRTSSRSGPSFARPATGPNWKSTFSLHPPAKAGTRFTRFAPSGRAACPFLCVLRFSCMKKHPAPLFGKAGPIGKGTLLQQRPSSHQSLFMMTVRVSDERSSRFLRRNSRRAAARIQKRLLRKRIRRRCCSYSPSSFFALL